MLVGVAVGVLVLLGRFVGVGVGVRVASRLPNQFGQKSESSVSVGVGVTTLLFDEEVAVDVLSGVTVLSTD